MKIFRKIYEKTIAFCRFMWYNNVNKLNNTTCKHKVSQWRKVK